MVLSQLLIKAALDSNDIEIIRLVAQVLDDPLENFKPRPDNPLHLDQQMSFFNDQFPGIACVLAGSGAGKTRTASAKVAKYLRQTPPPEKNTPFWIASTRMEDVGAIAWQQNLSHFIPSNEIQDIVWYSEKSQLPRTVILKPHNNGNNYIISLKSYEEEREKWQGVNTAGFWLDEQIPNWNLMNECLARTRKWTIPGSKIYTLTPLNPDPKLEQYYSDTPKSWQFYRMNTRVAATYNHVTNDYIQQIGENELAELIETRLTGAFASYEGQIYKDFDNNIHVIKPFDIPHNALRIRGLDIGWSHNTACVWLARIEDTFYVYREYLAQKTSVEDHVAVINDDWITYPVRGSTYADYAAAQILHEFRIRGLDTVGADKDVRSGIAQVQSLLRLNNGKPKLYIFNNCTNLIQQLRSYVYARDTGKPKKENAGYLMDLCDAMRYACYSYQQDYKINVKPVQIQHVPRKFNF